MLAVVLFILTGVLFAALPANAEFGLKAIAAVLAAVLAIGLFRSAPPIGTDPAPSLSNAKTEAQKPAPSASTKGSAEAEVVAFLARMQEKGRLIDFLMDDISAADDEAIGAAARIVHQGCKEVVAEHLDVEPVESAKSEGEKITLEEGYDASAYRLTGDLKGDAPFNGTLVHKGWKVTSAKLPKVIASDSGDLPVLAPAQVQI